MSFSDYAEKAILEHVFKVASMTVPTNLYVGLCTVAPTDADTGSTVTEPSGNGYARKLHNSWATVSLGVGSTSNVGSVTFNAASGGAWGTVTHFIVVDGLTGGNIIGKGQLASSRLVSDTDQVEFGGGSLVASLD